MVKKNNDIRVKRTKKLIRKGMYELAKEKSIAKITVKELADRININRGTFYLHYKDISDFIDNTKKDLFEEFNQIAASINNSMIYTNPDAILERICVFISDNSDICEMLMSPNGDAAFTYEFGSIINDRCFEIFLGIYPEINKEKYNLTYEYCKFGAIGLIRCWLLEYPERTPRQIAELWMSMLRYGLWGVLDERSRGIFK